MAVGLNPRFGFLYLSEAFCWTFLWLRGTMPGSRFEFFGRSSCVFQTIDGLGLTFDCGSASRV